MILPRARPRLLGSLLVRLLLTRLLGTAAVLAVVAAIVFWVLEWAPGDAASQLLGNRATAESLAALRTELGLDRPTPVRFAEWMGGLLTGDPGRSLVSGRPVAEVLAAPVARTVALAAAGMLVVILVGVGGGVAAGLRAGSRRDRAISAAAVGTTGTPEFVLGSLLVVTLSLGLGLFPPVSQPGPGASVLARPELLVLPALTVGLVAGGYVARLVRAIVADHAGRAHVEAARLDGAPPWTVLTRHLLPGAAGPVAGAVALAVPYLIGGTVVTERVFGYPGLGSSLVAAVDARDQVLVQSATILIAAVTALTFLGVDLLPRALDPFRGSVPVSA